MGPVGGLVGGIAGSLIGFFKADEYDGVALAAHELESATTSISNGRYLSSIGQCGGYITAVVVRRKLSYDTPNVCPARLGP
jgi:hypothetical protein